MNLKTKIFVFASLTGLFLGLAPSLASAYGPRSTGVIYVSPSSSSVEKGHEFSVGVRINPGTSVDSVQTTLYYSTADLQFVSSSPSAFPVCTVNSGGGGSVQLACTILGGSTSSDSLISTVTFKALAGSGSTSLSLASPGTGGSNSNAARSGNWTNPSVSGGSVRFTSPSSSGGSSGSGGANSGSHSTSTSTVSTTGGSTNTTSSTAKPNKAAPTPKLTVSVDNTSADMDSATINASTNIAASAYVQYGLSQAALNQSSAKTSGTSHKLDINGLIPGTTYYYQVLATGSQGQKASSAVASFTTKGYTLAVTILDSNYKPLANQKVTLHSNPITSTTNSQGIATFYNVPPGEHHLDYSSAGKDYSQAVYVDNDAPSDQQSIPAQTAAVILPGLRQNTVSAHKSSRTAWIVLAAIFIYLISWAVLLRKVVKTRLLAVTRSIADKSKNKSLLEPAHNFVGTIHQPGKK